MLQELLRAELGAFWERWGPQAFRVEANIQDWTGVPREGATEQVQWVADRWFSSAKSVINDFVTWRDVSSNGDQKFDEAFKVGRFTMIHFFVHQKLDQPLTVNGP